MASNFLRHLPPGIRRSLVPLAVLLAFILQPAGVGAAESSYTIDPSTGRREAIPSCYEYEETIAVLEGLGSMKGIRDLYMTGDDRLFVADTGNDRILSIDPATGTATAFTGPDDRPLKGPEGVFVDAGGDLYIADTGNERIVHLSPDGTFIEAFVKPESELLGPNFRFTPRKVALSPTGYLYTIKDQSMLQLDAYNNFRGYVGSTRLEFSLNALLIRLFATAEQKSRLRKAEPASYLNFCLASDGFVYATSLDRKGGQIRKLNSIGKNIFPEHFYGERSFDEAGLPVDPKFEAIAVDRNGIVNVVDINTGRIYQYTRDGVLLTVFGLNGNKKGMFSAANGLAVDSGGRIFVSDYATGTIQVFRPTRFIREIHSAIGLFQDGRYEEAEIHWRNVQEVCETYRLAYDSLGRIDYKADRFSESMESYFLAGNKEGYSLAFVELRHEWIRDHFAWVVLAALVVLLAGIQAIRRFRRYSAENVDRLARGGKNP